MMRELTKGTEMDTLLGFKASSRLFNSSSLVNCMLLLS